VSLAFQNVRRGSSRGATMVGARSGAWRPRRQSVEHLASDEVGKVGADFGPTKDRIGLWALSEVC
jgi:hypothetical protein